MTSDRWKLAILAGALLAILPIDAAADEPAPLKGDPADDAPSRPLVSDDAAPPPADPLGPDATIDRWCAPELDALTNDVCAFSPSNEAPGPRTLVIFLHGVVKPGTTWQWAQQRGAKRAAEANGFSVIMPHGRVGIGPKGMEDWWAWPTANNAQAQVEDELIAEWEGARAELEASTGRPFDRVWVFGFSNGAYYATSLATRGRLAKTDGAINATGFAVFAGGSGAAYLEKAAKAQTLRSPMFVGWGGKDPAHGDQEKLASMLHRLDWPSKSEGAKHAGHTMTDKQVTDAVRFLSSSVVTKTKASEPSTPKRVAAKHSSKSPARSAPKAK